MQLPKDLHKYEPLVLRRYKFALRVPGGDLLRISGSELSPPTKGRQTALDYMATRFAASQRQTTSYCGPVLLPEL
jgi:hypothetical protein